MELDPAWPFIAFMKNKLDYFGGWRSLLLLGLLATMSVYAETKNGFDLADSLIPADKVFSGGPPKDGIASIDNPVFVGASETKLMLDQRVMGVSFAGHTRAYPIAILNRHEVVNDQFGEYHVAVTYCPLCGSGMVFRAPNANQALTFGVSGLLYNSDVLLYDRETESLWSQLQMQAVTGPRKGEKLKMLASSHTTWQEWLSRYPDTEVLSEDTGFAFDYSRDPYAAYKNSGDTWFPVAHQNSAYEKKEWVAGVVIDGQAKAYPFVELEQSSGDFTDHVGDVAVRVIWLKSARSVRILDLAGVEVPATSAYWFAWYGFHPDTEIYRANQVME